MDIPDNCARALCGIGVGLGLVATGAMVSGVTEILKGSGELAVGVSEAQRDQLDAIVKARTKTLKRDIGTWLKADHGNDWSLTADNKAALAQLPEALVSARLTVDDIVRARNAGNAKSADALHKIVIARLPEHSLFKTNENAASVMKTLVTNVRKQTLGDEKLLAEFEAARFEVVQERFDDAQADRDTKHAATQQSHDAILAAIAADKGVPPENLAPLFETVGRKVPEADFERHIKEAVEAIIAQGAQTVQHFNDPPMIAAAITAARDKLKQADAAGALSLLEAREAEAEEAEKQARRARARLPLERAAILRSTFDRQGAIAAYEKAAELNETDAWGLFHAGDLYREAGNLDAAYAAYAAGGQRAEEQGNERDLSVSYSRIGDVERGRGNGDAALQAYEADLAIAKSLSERDPSNTGWQRDLSVSDDRIGDVELGRGNGDAALRAYEAGLAIRKSLSERDASNTEWQRDLSVSYNKIGDVELGRGNGDAALEAYEAGLAIRKSLSERDASNTDWQRDLSVSHNKIGDVELGRGNGDAALAAYKADLAIAKSLSERDPSNTDWQRDLIVSNVKLAETGGDPMKHYAEALVIAERMQSEGRLLPVDEWMVPELRKRLAEAEAKD